MKNIGLFVDTFDLYRRVRHIFDNKIDYENYLAKVNELGKVVKCLAYGMQSEGGFISCLKILGFETRFKNPKIIKDIKFCDWNVQIAMDVVRLILDNEIELDTVIFGSCSLGLLPLIKWLKEKVGHRILYVAGGLLCIFRHFVNCAFHKVCRARLDLDLYLLKPLGKD